MRLTFFKTFMESVQTLYILQFYGKINKEKKHPYLLCSSVTLDFMIIFINSEPQTEQLKVAELHRVS